MPTWGVKRVHPDYLTAPEDIRPYLVPPTKYETDVQRMRYFRIVRLLMGGPVGYAEISAHMPDVHPKALYRLLHRLDEERRLDRYKIPNEDIGPPRGCFRLWGLEEQVSA